MSLLPLTDQKIDCYKGYSWSQEWDFYSDDANTVPFDLTNPVVWTPTLRIVERDGSSTDATVYITGTGHNEVVASLNATQTGTLQSGIARYALYLTDSGDPTDKEPLVTGAFNVKELL